MLQARLINQRKKLRKSINLGFWSWQVSVYLNLFSSRGVVRTLLNIYYGAIKKRVNSEKVLNNFAKIPTIDSVLNTNLRCKYWKVRNRKTLLTNLIYANITLKISIRKYLPTTCKVWRLNMFLLNYKLIWFFATTFAMGNSVVYFCLFDIRNILENSINVF